MSDSRSMISQTLPFGPVNVGPTERIVTGGIGGALLLLGLDRGRAAGTLMALAGGVLLTRAVTGHCPAYQAMGRGHADDEFGRFDPGRYEDFERDDFTTAELGGRMGGGSMRNREDVAEVLSGPHPSAQQGRGNVPEEDDVEQASELSFPASDPPSYMGDRVGHR
ncbi:YgaP family membrane protein [Indioceanicola profundi]|uniref:YgaP family membrane protein n=1 Tax=Indioceanicola profundi TaxID=2220096 RepID=UPI0013C4B0EF|nr:DUF2892 domain-containing protein [Indioceanicola profundi]